MQQWQQLADAGELLAAAPDDEIAAEMLALQAELMQQVRVADETAAGCPWPAFI